MAILEITNLLEVESMNIGSISIRDLEFTLEKEGNK